MMHQFITDITNMYILLKEISHIILIILIPKKLVKLIQIYLHSNQGRIQVVNSTSEIFQIHRCLRQLRKIIGPKRTMGNVREIMGNEVSV